MSEDIIEISNEKFLGILSMVEKAKSDNERFAALLVVSKLTRGGSILPENRKELLKAIGIQFPLRLVKTACSQTTEENKFSFVSIGMSILWSFCADVEFFRDEGLEAIVPHLLKVVKLFSNEEKYESVIEDCMDCLIALTYFDDCISEIIESDAFNTLCLCEKQSDKSHHFISMLLSKQPHLWQNKQFQKWFKSLANVFKIDQTNKKFTICTHLFQILTAYSSEHLLGYHEAITDIMCGLEDVLCSKLNTEQRKSPIQLASEIFRLFGISWFTMNSKKTNFIVIVTRLSCIEIGLFLRNISNDIESNFSENLSVIMSCFFISEAFCSAVAKFEQNDSEKDDILSFEQIRLTQPALADLANSVSIFISSYSVDDETGIPDTELLNLLLPICIRFLGSWLNIENNVTSAQGNETLPILKQVLKYIVKHENLLLLECTLPAVMQAASAMSTHDTIIKNGILQSLICVIDLIEKKLHYPGKMDNLVTFHIVLQSLISVCSTMTNVECQDYHNDLSKIFSIMTILVQKPLSIQTFGYVYPLSSILLNKSSCSISDDILCKIFKFLFDAYEVSPTDGHPKVSPNYQESWQEICPLWKLCAEEITSYIASTPEVKKKLIGCEHRVFLRNLFDAASAGKDEELTNIFFNLLEVLKLNTFVQ
ncbi:neurochondrin-like [Styela clava]